MSKVLADVSGVTDVGSESDGIRTAAVRQIGYGAVEEGPGSADQRHPGAVLGKTTGGRQTHAAATADDDSCGIRQP
jgi:hypothetical protein